MNGGGLPIARILGIEIRMSPIWAVLVAVVAVIGSQQAALTAPQLGEAVHWAIGAAVAALFLLSVVAHELAHALTGRHVGLESRTITLGFVGGFTPTSRMAPRPGDELLVAVAGPLASLVIAVLCVPLAVGAVMLGPGFGAVSGGLIVVGALNLVLGVLSLVPAAPLDGGRAVRALAWARTGDPHRAGRITARVGRLLGYGTFALGAALALVGYATEGLLVLCLGWLLNNGSRSLDRRLGLEELMRGVPVRDAMRRDVPEIPPQVTVDTFAGRYEGEEGLSTLPVVDDGHVLGVIGLRRLQRLGHRRFATTRAADVMIAPPQAPFLAPDGPLWDAVELMNQAGLEGLAVVAAGALEGMLTRESIGSLVRIRSLGREPVR